MDYVLDELTLAEAINLRADINREIFRLWKANKNRDHLIDRYDELSIVIFNLQEAEGEE